MYAAFYLLVRCLWSIKTVENSFALIILSMVIPFLLFCVAYTWLKRKKRVSEFLQQSFASENYTILAERPLTFSESFENLPIEVGIYSNIPIGALRYKSRLKRHFIVRNEKNHDFELIVSVVQTWGDDFKYHIDSKSRIRD